MQSARFHTLTCLAWHHASLLVYLLFTQAFLVFTVLMFQSLLRVAELAELDVIEQRLSGERDAVRPRQHPRDCVGLSPLHRTARAHVHICSSAPKYVVGSAWVRASSPWDPSAGRACLCHMVSSAYPSSAVAHGARLTPTRRMLSLPTPPACSASNLRNASRPAHCR